MSISAGINVRFCLSESAGLLLHSFTPGWRITHGHEHTVGQDGKHDEHTEQSEKQSRSIHQTILFYLYSTFYNVHCEITERFLCCRQCTV